MPAAPKPREGLAAIVGLVLLASGAGLTLSEVYLPRLLGVALITVVASLGLPWLVKLYPFVWGKRTFAGRSYEMETVARRAVPIALLLLLVCSLMWPLLLGQMPRSQDHTVHLTRAWIFANELIGRGRITGWSSIWFAGYPAGQLYPPGSDLWVMSFRALHLFLPDWSVTYAHAFLASTALGALAIYWLTARATESRLAATIAGLIWILDPGAYREGGWSFTVYWGVWSQILGLTFSTLALVALDKAIVDGSSKWTAIAAFLAGFALLGHPMSLVTLVLWASGLIIARWGYGRLPRHGFARAIGVGVWGGLLAAWWLIPFVSRSEWTIKVPELWRSMDQAAEGVLRGAPFQNHWPLIGVLALVGIVRAFRERRPLLIGLALSVGALLFFSTTTAFSELSLEEISASFARIIYQRFSMPAKIGWFVLAAHGAASVLTGYRVRPSDDVDEPAPRWRRLVFICLGALVLAPFLLHGVERFGEHYMRGVGGIRLATSESDFADYHHFLDWSRERWQERDRFYRIAYLQPRNEHFFADAPVYNGTPAYKVGWTPCTTFRHRPESDDPEVLRNLSVRYVVSRQPVQGGHVSLEREFGNVRVYRLRNERGQRFHIDGPGRGEVLQFDDELIRIRVDDAERDTKLTVHVARYADWSASLDGEQLAPIRTVPIYGERYPTFMQVDVPRAGIVEFRFRRPPLRIVCQITSFLALIAILLTLGGRRFAPIRRFGERVGLALERLAPAAPIFAAIGIAAVIVIVLLRLLGGSSDPLSRLSYDFSDHLETARAELVRGQGRTACSRVENKLRCGRQSWGFVGIKQVKVGILERPCIWAHPYQDSKLRIVFPDVPLAKSLVGRHGLSDFAATQTPEGTPVELRVEIEGEELGHFIAPNEVGWRQWRVDTTKLAGERRDVTFVIESTRANRRQYCFQGGVLESGRIRD